jgi:hypothetical protein
MIHLLQLIGSTVPFDNGSTKPLSAALITAAPKNRQEKISSEPAAGKSMDF